MKRNVLVLLSFFVASAALGEDPKERAYQVPALPPKHKDKPRVSGWAKRRVEEKLDR